MSSLTVISLFFQPTAAIANVVLAYVLIGLLILDVLQGRAPSPQLTSFTQTLKAPAMNAQFCAAFFVLTVFLISWPIIFLGIAIMKGRN